jgi:ferredoxin
LYYSGLALGSITREKELPMKVRIDPDLCTGCGLCTDSVPEVFKMGDDVAEVTSPNVPANMEKAVKEAADDCPAEAIIVE